MKWAPRLAIEHDDRLALVGDPDRVGDDAGLLDRVAAGRHGGLKQRERIVLSSFFRLIGATIGATVARCSSCFGWSMAMNI